MPFTHVVLFQFKDSVDAEAIQAVGSLCPPDAMPHQLSFH